MTWFRRHYGEGPVHLLLSTACLGFAGYLVWTVVPAANSLRIFIWIAVAAGVHDLILWPLYAVLDRVVVGPLLRRPSRRRLPVPLTNHIRVPVILSAVMLLISFPLVLRHSEPAYHAATGLTEQPYLGRWLFLSGGAFCVSAVAYVARLLRNRPNRPAR